MISVAAAGCHSGKDDVVLVGTVERTLIELAAPVSETLIEVGVRRGERVSPGQVVARLDPTLAEADAAGAEATLAGARAAMLTGERDLERFTGLRQTRIVSAQDIERAQLTRDEAAARLREAETRLTASRKRLADLTLIAPVAGTVDQIPFDPGERVSAGAVIVVLLDDAAPWVRVWLPEPSLARVTPGSVVRIRVDGLPQSFTGQILDVAREAEFTPHYALTERDRVHLVYETRVGISAAPDSLRPGVPAEVTLLLDSDGSS